MTLLHVTKLLHVIPGSTLEHWRASAGWGFKVYALRISASLGASVTCDDGVMSWYVCCCWTAAAEGQQMIITMLVAWLLIGVFHARDVIDHCNYGSSRNSSHAEGLY